MSGAARIISLITTPLPLFLHRHPRPRPFLLSISLLRRSLTPISRSGQKFHSLSSPTAIRNDPYGVSSSSSTISHPWPEWSRFVDSLSSFGNVLGGRGGGDAEEDGIVAYEELSEDFVRVVDACLDFARKRPDLLSVLSRRDIEVVVENGTPFLFKSALDTTRRMKVFLDMGGDNNVLESDKAKTVDLMKYLLSYASNTAVSSDTGGIYRGELLESSVRNLLSQLSSCGAEEANPSMAYNIGDRYGQTSRKLGPNIEMKRGDWICLKCNFMNFARNMKCLECEEARPKRLLTGREWECPQCDFFNYGRNQVCLRCDCKRPNEASFNTNSSSNPTDSNTSYANKPDIESKLAANEEKAQRWFSKISQTENTSDLSNSTADEDFPEIMPLRKGENKFVVSTRKTPLERRLANNNDFTHKASNSEGRGPNHVPFVPFPSDKFAEKPLNSNVEEVETTDSLSKSSEKSDSIESSDKEKEQDKKPESWFKKMAELQGVEDLSTIPKTEDFPEIMPMRKGENRFVVSKKKDRSLTSPMYKRKIATEQAINTNFVPFVPFPPDYFAKKNKDQNTSDPTPKDKTANSQSSTISNTIENQQMGTENRRDETITSPSPSLENRQKGSIVNSDLGWKGKSLEGSAVVEPDPLDMSEEAKAQRWFRRAAQIKDISELSQIPDEDFPSIMPMRKGVNRFVVSKRKTPLERRLTSPQYKRNLPIVHSDTLKNENENENENS